MPEIPTDGASIVLNLENFDVRDVLTVYARLTGRSIARDSTIQGQISVVSARVTRAQAIKLIEATLLLNGFTLVDRDNDTTLVLGLSKNARGAGVPIVTRVEDLPPTDRVVSFLFKVKHHDPVRLQQQLQQYVTANLYTSFVADRVSRTLLVTESSPVLRQVAGYIAEIDTVETGKNLSKIPPEAPQPPKAKAATR